MMNWINTLTRDSVLSNAYEPLRAHDESGGGGGGTEIPQPLVVSSTMFKNLNAAKGYIAMQLFINSNFDAANGVIGKSPNQAAKDAVVRAGAIIDEAGDLIQELCGE